MICPRSCERTCSASAPLVAEDGAVADGCWIIVWLDGGTEEGPSWAGSSIAVSDGADSPAVSCVEEDMGSMVALAAASLALRAAQVLV
jgi:hypothetical protein